MVFYGLNKTTLLDFPEHVAAVLFTGGCSFRCPFCHNGGLVLEPNRQREWTEQEILSFLKKRIGILEGICVTGGEPTLHRGLEEFLYRVKELGYLVKLDTNGYQPDILWNLMKKDLLDYIAMDVKSSRRGYACAAGINHLDLARIEESIVMLKNSEIPYEFRTTVVKGLHTQTDFEEIGRWLEGCRAYYLQLYRDSENVLSSGYQAFDRKEMEQFALIAGKYIMHVRLRGME